MKNKILIIFIIILIFCGIFTFTKKKSSDEALVFWTLQLGTFDSYLNKVIKDFEEENPDIKIKWVDVPYSEGEKRTLAALLSDNPPDLINLTQDFALMATRKNALLEIPQEIMDNFPAAVHNSLSYNGKFFTIPFYLTSAITFANQDLIEKSKINVIPDTFDKMYSFAENVKKETGKYIDMPTISENDTFWKILNKYQIDIFSELNTYKSIEIFEMYKNLYEKGYIPKESITQSHREALEKYMAGEIVFLQAGANFLNIVKENAPAIYEKTVIAPQLTGVSGEYDFSLMNLIIPIKSNKKEQALKFAKYLTNKENQLEFAKLTSVLPANKEALSDSYFKSSKTKEDIARKISASQINNLSRGIQNYRNKKNIVTLLNTSIVKIMTNSESIEKEINNLSKKINNFNE